MKISFKLTQKEFIDANFAMLYSKTGIKIFTGVIIFSLLISIASAILNSTLPPIGLLIPLAVLIAVYLLTYFNAKKNYTAERGASEQVEYEFNDELLLIKGESFQSQLTWNKIYKLTQTKKWLWIWTNRQLAIPIPKRAVSSEHIISLKKIAKANKVKHKL